MALHAPPPLLTDELKLPARTSRDVFNACNPQFDLVGKDLVLLREDLSGVRGKERIQRLEDCIRNSRRGQYLVQLLSGHPGSGKSTELRWLASELQKTKDDRSFHALFVDLQDYLDIRDTQLPELVTALFSAIVDDPILGAYASASATARKVWKDLVARAKTIGLSLDAEVPIGVVKLKASFKTSPGFQKRYREVSRDHMTSLVQGFSELIEEVRSHLVKQGVDSLDDDRRQWLLYELVVLEYNGDTWYDVHPFVRRTHAYRLAAPQHPAKD